MIALDEDMVGSDPNIVIAQGLKVCLGLFVTLANGSLLGAHFTPMTPLSGMNLIMGHIRVAAAGNVAWMGMVAKFNRWANASSGLTTKQNLAAYFRTQMLFPGAMTYADLAWAATSYDIRCSTGITPMLEYRATPNPNPTVATPLANVLQLTNHSTVLSATNGAHPGALHMVPTGVAGFARLSSDLHTL